MFIAWCNWPYQYSYRVDELPDLCLRLEHRSHGSISKSHVLSCTLGIRNRVVLRGHMIEDIPGNGPLCSVFQSPSNCLAGPDI